MKNLEISTAKTAELLAFYNEHAAKPVAKFADRKTAEKRVAALLATIEPVASETAAPEATEAPQKSHKTNARVAAAPTFTAATANRLAAAW